FLFFMKPMMKTMIGMDYDRGLKMLKEWLETGSVSASTEIKGVESVGPIRMAGVTSTCHVNDIAEDMGRSIELAEARFLTLKLPAEEGVSVYTGFKMSQGLFSYITGFMIPDSAAEQLEGLQVWSLPACKALRVDQTGCYTHLGNGWSAANQHARYKKLKQAKLGTFEIYRKSPHHTDVPSEYETEIYLPLR
ncbi:MAG: GyrI-like domain-containing protein, partial [Planctomycetaceae bacterium]